LPQISIPPKTAAEHWITCLSPAPGAGDTCGAPVIWLDFELGEKEFYKGFVCDAGSVSCNAEKLILPHIAKAVDELKSSRIIAVSTSVTCEL
jgi:hypothetical protein